MSKSETFTETLVDEAGIEILVNYSKEWNDQKEDFHGEHDLSGWGYNLNSVELVIAGSGINITKQLNLKQYQAILDEVIELDREKV